MSGLKSLSIDNTLKIEFRFSAILLSDEKRRIDTAKLEQPNQNFISKIENKLRKVKQPSKDLKWYVAMWIITLASAFLVGYFIRGIGNAKDRATYWYQMYEEG